MKIAIDIGHNCYPDSGAIEIGNENIMVMEVGKRVISKLQALGHTVIVVTPTTCSSVSDSLWQRVNKANSSEAQLYVSLHENAGGGKGTEVWIGSERSRKVAEQILNNIVNLGFRNRGVKVQGVDGSRLYVLNHTTMPAILVEGCFVDSQEDMNRFNAEDMANAIVAGIAGQTIAGVSTEQNSQKPASTSTVDGNNSQTSSKSVDPNIKNLQIKLNGLINAGLDVDGIYGLATIQTVKKFQRLMGITEDGIAGANTWSAINAILAKPLSKNGSKGYSVRWIQWRVGAAIDGIFGNDTKVKVQRFQSSNGLTSDGIVGDLTWNQMFR